MTIAEKYKLDQPVIIFGVHRSGTSLLTRMMEKLGLFVGRDLQGDHESKIIIAISNHYLNRTNSSWDAPHYPREEDVRINYVARAFDANFDTIAKSFGPMTGFWGMKDPRMVITLPLWLRIFPQAKIIYIKRSPVPIAKSLSTRHNELIEKGIFPAEGDFNKGRIKFTQRCKTYEGALEFAMEQISVANALMKSEHVPEHLELEYEQLVHDPVQQLANVAGYLGREFTAEQILAAAGMPRQKQVTPLKEQLKTHFPHLV